MNRANAFVRARQQAVVTWANFVRAFAKDPHRLYCFFEGEDAKYYGIRIDNLVPNNRRAVLDCAGKASVLYCFDLLSKNSVYQHAWVAFFIDKDYDERGELPSDRRIYITPCYSIENLYASENAFRRLLQDEFQLTELDDDGQQTDGLINLYKERLLEFNHATEQLNAWAYLVRRHEKLNPGSLPISLNHLNFNEIVSVSLQTITKTYTVISLHLKYPQTVIIDVAKIEAQAQKFRSGDQTYLFRGKYLMAFYREFLVKIKDDCCSDTPRYLKNKLKVSLIISKINLISELSQSADTPECLVAFLQSISTLRP